MKTHSWFADVILPLPLPHLYTYRIPGNMELILIPGSRVIVQFGRRKIYTAIVKELHQNEPADYTVREIISVLDEKPVINLKQLKFWEWIAEYYLCTPGEVFKAAIPSNLKPESETWIYPATIKKHTYLTDTEALLHSILLKNQGLTLKQLLTFSGGKSLMPAIKSMLEKNIILVEEKLKEKYRPKYNTFIRLTGSYRKKSSLNKLIKQLEKSPKQLHMLMIFLELAGMSSGNIMNLVEKPELIKKAAVSKSVLSAMIKKGVFESFQSEIIKTKQQPAGKNSPVKLNQTQESALNKILDLLNDKEVVLLHGVTSSGKTEIYIHLIAGLISKNKQVLYLLPEIALTVQIISRLKKIFGERVGIYHSRLSNAERLEIYQNIQGHLKSGEMQYQVILGVRSSVFLPFDNLGLIIVDEEHENTFKQFDPAPRYHARDAAIYLARLHNARVLLGSATPSLESYLNSQSGKFGLVELNERFLNIELPEIKVVDLKEARKKKEMHSHFSSGLLNTISEALRNNEQVILFQNRRGFSPYLECDNCGWVPVCIHCDVSLTYHKENNRLICHYCGYTVNNLKKCHACGHNSLMTRGFGTEKIEEETGIIFPGIKSGRLDLDSARKRDAYQRLIGDFENGKIRILIGTQMISKGLDFSNVKVVGILNADNMLNYPDFRSFERSYQLMAQVGGRAGRKKGRGIVFIQTSDPSNTVIRNVVRNDYVSMVQNQLSERKRFGYPPYTRLINITLKHRQKSVLNEAAGDLASRINNIDNLAIAGPEFPLVSRIQNLYLKNILVKLQKNKRLKENKILIKKHIDDILESRIYGNLKINTDVDPM